MLVQYDQKPDKVPDLVNLAGGPEVSRNVSSQDRFGEPTTISIGVQKLIGIKRR